jgi:hypothetical protein
LSCCAFNKHSYTQSVINTNVVGHALSMNKLIKITLVLLLLSANAWTDIGPNPIAIKGIIATQPCDIQMVSETVIADLYPDSSIVRCTFNMINHGDSITLPVGFPVMNFFHWNLLPYSKTDKDHFTILVGDKKLNRNDILVPGKLQSIYDEFMAALSADEEYKRRRDSVDIKYDMIKRNGRTKNKDNASYYKAISTIDEWRKTKPWFGLPPYQNQFLEELEKGNYPWYVWNVPFKKGESKVIQVTYSVPSGSGYRAEYRYFNYLLNTGSGWKDKIDQVDVVVKLHGIKFATIQKIYPEGHILTSDTKTLKWTFSEIEPSTENDIYIQYSRRK